MCIDPATLGLVAKGVGAATSVLSAVQGQRNAKAAEKAGEQQAEAEINQGIVLQEQALRENKIREGNEINNIAASGISGAFGSPFLAALESAENAQINKINIGRNAGQRANAARQGAAAQASKYRSGAIASLGKGVSGAIGAYKGYQKDRATERFVLGGTTLPGVY